MKSVKTIGLTSLLLFFIVLLGLAIPTKATIYYDNAPLVKQLQSNWCWAASAEMIAKNRKSDAYDQMDIVKYIYGDTRNSVGTCAQVASGAKWATGFTSNFVALTNYLSFSSVCSALSGNWAIACMAYDSYKGHGHMFVIKTADDSNQGLYLYDPAVGNDNFWISHNDFVNNGIFYDIIRWRETVY